MKQTHICRDTRIGLMYVWPLTDDGHVDHASSLRADLVLRDAGLSRDYLFYENDLPRVIAVLRLAGFTDIHVEDRT